MKKSLPLAPALLAAALLLAGCSGAGPGFLYYGTIEGTEIPVQTEIGGTVESMAAEEGQPVRAGDVMARLDRSQAGLQVDEAKAALDSAKAKWEEAKAGSRSEELMQAAAQYEQAQMITQQALARIRSAEEQIAVLSAVKEQLVKDSASAKETHVYNERRLNQTMNRYDSGQASQEQIDQLKETVNQSNRQVNSLEAQSKSTEAQIAQAQHEREAAVALKEQAAAGEKAAEAKLALVSAGSTDYQLRSLLALRDQAASRLAQAQLAADKTAVAAPEDGVVLRRLTEKGEVVKPASSLYTLLKAGELHITVYVPEANLNEVRLGRTAEIAVDAYPGDVFSGTVTHVADKAEFTPKNVQTPEERTKMVFAVKVRLTSGLDRLKPGMPADVRFVAEAAKEQVR